MLAPMERVKARVFRALIGSWMKSNHPTGQNLEPIRNFENQSKAVRNAVERCKIHHPEINCLAPFFNDDYFWN